MESPTLNKLVIVFDSLSIIGSKSPFEFTQSPVNEGLRDYKKIACENNECVCH